MITENQRVMEFYDRMTGSNLEKIGKLIYESHNSLKNEYQASWDEANFIVDLSYNVEGVIGARMHGAGSGGCVLLIVAKESIEKISEIISDNFQTKYNFYPQIYQCIVTEGVKAASTDFNKLPIKIQKFFF